MATNLLSPLSGSASALPQPASAGAPPAAKAPTRPGPARADGFAAATSPLVVLGLTPTPMPDGTAIHSALTALETDQRDLLAPLAAQVSASGNTAAQGSAFYSFQNAATRSVMLQAQMVGPGTDLGRSLTGIASRMTALANPSTGGGIQRFPEIQQQVQAAHQALQSAASRSPTAKATAAFVGPELKEIQAIQDTLTPLNQNVISALQSGDVKAGNAAVQRLHDAFRGLGAQLSQNPADPLGRVFTDAANALEDARGAVRSGPEAIRDADNARVEVDRQLHSISGETFREIGALPVARKGSLFAVGNLPLSV